MSDTDIVESLKRDLGAKALELTNPDRRRIFLKVAATELVPTVTLLRDKYDCAYLATVSGVDKGEVFEFLYHFASPVVNINVRIVVPRVNIPTARLRGRILVPPALRRYASLDRRVVLVGQGRKFELWDDAAWAARTAQAIAFDGGGLPPELDGFSL